LLNPLAEVCNPLDDCAAFGHGVPPPAGRDYSFNEVTQHGAMVVGLLLLAAADEQDVFEVMDHIGEQLGAGVHFSLKVPVQRVLDVVDGSSEGGEAARQQLEERLSGVVEGSHPGGAAVACGGVLLVEPFFRGVRQLVVVFHLLHFQKFAHEVRSWKQTIRVG